MRCPKSRFSIRIIVFDKLELIIFVSQGLTLSTASLVAIIIMLPGKKISLIPETEDCKTEIGFHHAL